MGAQRPENTPRNRTILSEISKLLNTRELPPHKTTQGPKFARVLREGVERSRREEVEDLGADLAGVAAKYAPSSLHELPWVRTARQ